MTDGVILCGTTISFEDGTLAKLLSISGLGASRAAIDMSNASSPSGWKEYIQSCLQELKQFTATVVCLTNEDWTELIAADPSTLTITWPIEDGYTTAATVAFSAFVTDVDIGGELEGRVTKTVQIRPTGVPTFTPGTGA